MKTLVAVALVFVFIICIDSGFSEEAATLVDNHVACLSSGDFDELRKAEQALLKHGKNALKKLEQYGADKKNDVFSRRHAYLIAERIRIQKMPVKLAEAEQALKVWNFTRARKLYETFLKEEQTYQWYYVRALEGLVITLNYLEHAKKVSPEEVNKTSNELLKADPENFWGICYQRDVKGKNIGYKAAMAILQTDPDNIGAQQSAIRKPPKKFLGKFGWNQRVRQWQKLFYRDPKNTHAPYNFISCLLQVGRIDEAREIWDKLYPVSPKDSNLWRYWASCHPEEWNRFINEDPVQSFQHETNEARLFSIAIILYNRSVHSRLSDHDPDKTKLYQQAARVAFERIAKEYKDTKAGKSFYEGGDVQSIYPTALYKLGSLQGWVDNDSQMAVKTYKLIAELSPEYAEVQTNLGHSYFKLKQYDLALSAYEKGIEDNFRNRGYQAMEGKARVLLEMNQKEKAIKALQNAMKWEGVPEKDKQRISDLLEKVKSEQAEEQQ